MEKLNMNSPDFTEQNIAKLAELFPNCVAESKDENGKLRKSIDFDLLKQELSADIVEGPKERYRLDWPGKASALITANKPIDKTLRPCRGESVDFDTTQNLFIEGDNLDALKLLQETYLGKIKMIYIDPPYNTGKDFIYKDKFVESIEEYQLESGQRDEEGSQLVANPESNGRFHSDWLSMLYPRLKLARNLLRDAGVIFISIDDSEQANLKRMCDEIFGEENFVETIVWKRRATPPNDRVIGRNHEYALVYSKDISSLEMYLQPRTKEYLEAYVNPDNDSRGPYRLSDLSGGSKGGRATESCVFPITDNTGKKHMPPQNKYWLYNQEKMDGYLREGRIGFRKGSGYPFLKRYLSEVRNGITLPTILYSTATSQDSAKEIRSMFGSDIFEFPKPTQYLKIMVQCGMNKDDLILDFFAGSATTAHAVMQLNAEDGGNRRFIMVQLQEKCNARSEASKAGYKNISEISKERIRRAGEKIKQENALTAPNLDTGFRVLKVDTANIADIRRDPDTIEQGQLSSLTENIKPDRTSEDLLFQVLLNWGVDLTLPVTKETVKGLEVFFVDNNALAACFAQDGQITNELGASLCKELATRNPLRVVFRDSGFVDDSVKINVEQTFKLLSTRTDVKTI